MTLDEARKVADIACQADGGCSNCVGHLLDELRAAFPEFDWGDIGSGGDLFVPYYDGSEDGRRYDRIEVNQGTK